MFFNRDRVERRRAWYQVHAIADAIGMAVKNQPLDPAWFDSNSEDSDEAAEKFQEHASGFTQANLF